jgi:hypothetical protein
LSGTLVSLSKARKAKARAEADLLAMANRAKFGRTKAEKLKAETEQKRTVSVVDQAFLVRKTDQ